MFILLFPCRIPDTVLKRSRISDLNQIIFVFVTEITNTKSSKIRSGIIIPDPDPGSGFFSIPNPDSGVGVKKAPDLESGFATLRAI
jgi:hypothetical protein